jgi:hypothetical protein
MPPVEIIVGLLIVCFTLYEIFRTVVFPHWNPGKFRISPMFIGLVIWPVWKALAKRIRSASLRELLLASYAPLSIMFLLVIWIILLEVGFAFILIGCADSTKPAFSSFWDALLCVGESLFTLGFDERTPVGIVPRFLLLIAAFFGIGAMALIISFLFALYSALVSRESRVILIHAQSGAPPSGLKLLLSYADLGLKSDLPGAFDTWHNWVAEMLEIHRACPVLLFFRSAEPEVSWVSALYAVLDASAIFLSSLELESKGYATLLHKTGSKTAYDLSLSLGPSDRRSDLSKADFDAGLKLLEKAGYKLASETDKYEKFLQLRSSYAPHLESMIEHLSHASAGWC